MQEGLRQYSTLIQVAPWWFCNVMQEAPWRYCRKPTGNFRTIHIIQNSFCSKLLRVQGQLFVWSPHTNCFEQSGLICAISYAWYSSCNFVYIICSMLFVFAIWLLHQELFKFCFVQLFSAVFFVKFISCNEVCVICFVKFVLCYLLFAFCFAQINFWNMLCEIGHM